MHRTPTAEPCDYSQPRRAGNRPLSRFAMSSLGARHAANIALDLLEQKDWNIRVNQEAFR